ncbi:O-antigen ligase family protein [Asticcacaulis sp.]|uniref:O-antigen ligase family protein n=1 Tax=Asticcacaulis sp. TaxID=1872648 RepID=UPI002B666DE0|nr:O-antigen ligase family protein [Asticcacaulis sp.]HTM83096.1 O-antigen ligase family protein [Asticcacaulis sp.]
MTDKLGLLSADRNKSLWRRIKADYTAWVLYAGLTIFGLWAYVSTTGLPALLLLIGLLSLGHLFLSHGSWKTFAPFVGLTALMLLLALFRSDFAEAVARGVPLAEAYKGSQLVITGDVTITVPMIIWVIAWASIFGARSLNDVKAYALFKWFAYVLTALAVVQFLEAVSHFGLRQMLSANVSKSRDNMLIVGFANTNCALLMMFWPLVMVQMARRKPITVIVTAVALVAAAFASDTNAHLLALLASTAVFFAVKYWPRALKAVAPERVMAVLSLIPMLLFPAIIYALMQSGIAQKIKTDLLPSWAARIDIWTYAVSRSLEKPMWGWGYEASRQFDPIIPNHPHDMALQAWLELGIPGLLLLAAFWFWLFWNMGIKGEVIEERVPSDGLRALDDKTENVPADGNLAVRFRPYLMAQATCFLVIGTISYGLWRAWFYCLGAFAVMAAILAIKAVRQSIKLRI